MQLFVSSFLIGFTLLLAGISAAQEAPPNNLRICVQLIEVPHQILTEIMAGNQTDGTALHQQAMALVKNGGAKVVDSNVVTTPSGRKATLESIREIMFPSEKYTNSGMCGLSVMSGFSAPQPPKPARNLRFIPPCYATRNTGVSLDVEPTLQDNGQIIELRMTSETVAAVGEISPLNYAPKWGGGPVRIPIFEAWRFNTSVNLMAGKFELVSLITPKNPAPAPAVLRKILVFVRADVLPVVPLP